MDEQNYGRALLNAMRGYFVGQKTGADAIKILGPTPSENQTQAFAVYNEFRSSIINGLNDDAYRLLVINAVQFYGDEGKRLLGRIADQVKRDGLINISDKTEAPVSPSQSGKSDKISASINDDLNRVLIDHSLMRRKGTLQKYLLSP